MKVILAKLRNRNELIEYTMAVYRLLVTDSEIEYILDAETGEVIFTIENNWLKIWKLEHYAGNNFLSCIISSFQKLKL